LDSFNKANSELLHIENYQKKFFISMILISLKNIWILNIGRNFVLAFANSPTFGHLNSILENNFKDKIKNIESQLSDRKYKMYSEAVSNTIL